jgi:hypothetical protein
MAKMRGLGIQNLPQRLKIGPTMGQEESQQRAWVF